LGVLALGKFSEMNRNYSSVAAVGV